MQPKVALLDEIDSGLDVDSLKLVNNALKIFKAMCPDSVLIIITHYQHILDDIHVDQVLVMKDGFLVSDGDASLINTIQQHGYDQF